MCRSIKVLHGLSAAVDDQEVREAALQFVRKISGYRVPSRTNQAVFDAAVEEVAAAAWRLLRGLQARRPAQAGLHNLDVRGRVG
ncbi:MAG: DUF2277 domain-containing protein [Chloroflexi bacterium]|nr:DUF2277 domain-containing protein [Chloroflexota bacterium]